MRNGLVKVCRASPFFFPACVAAGTPKPGGQTQAASACGLQVGAKLEKYLDQVVQRAARATGSAGPDQLQALQLALDEIDALGVEGAAPVPQDLVSSVDRRLKACRNPLADPSSDASKAAAAAKAKVKADKKARKVSFRGRGSGRERLDCFALC